MTWRETARRLGERMENHAFCGDHPNLADADPRNCPFCDDRAAYLEWREKERGS